MTTERLNEAIKVRKRIETLQNVRENIRKGYDENGCFRRHTLTQIEALYTLEEIDTANIERLILDYIDKTEDKLYKLFREI